MIMRVLGLLVGIKMKNKLIFMVYDKNKDKSMFLVFDTEIIEKYSRIEELKVENYGKNIV